MLVILNLPLVKNPFFNYNVNVYTLEPVSPQRNSDWDAVIQRCLNSNVFQSSVWRDALTHSFKQLNPVYLLIKEGKSVIGGVPAFVFQPIPGIRLWYSMPWNLFGGPLLINSTDVNIDQLISSIETYLQSVALEKRWCEMCWTFSPDDSVKYGDALTAAGYEKTDHFTHLLKTDCDIDTLWQTYNKRVRGAVRKAQKSGVAVTDTDCDKDIAIFYNMYLATVKRLGGTPKPHKLMEYLLHHGIAKLAIATYQDTIIAGLLYLHFNRTVTLWCEASLPEFLQYRPNNAIFHHIITLACDEGYEWVDFGASPPENAGLIAHKEQYRAKRTDFCSYTKTILPVQRSLWTSSESLLRKIYTRLQ